MLDCLYFHSEKRKTEVRNGRVRGSNPARHQSPPSVLGGFSPSFYRQFRTPVLQNTICWYCRYCTGIVVVVVELLTLLKLQELLESAFITVCRTFLYQKNRFFTVSPGCYFAAI